MNVIRNVVLVATLAAISTGRLSAADGPAANATIVDSSWSSGTYTYDGAGNVTQIGGDAYRYDEFGRLARATVGSPTVPALTTTQQFAYDAYGNLTSIVTAAPSGTRMGGFAVNPATNQLTGDCPAGSDPCFRGVYDPGTGNQLGRTTGNEYRWDATGMLIELDQPAVRHERYVYDANDERIVIIDYASSSPETKRRYALRGVDAKVARELTYTPSTNTWELTKDYVYRGGVLLASFTGNEIEPSRHFHIDHLGTPRLITDGNGYRLAAHAYLPFGREAEGSEADTERMKFTGHERDGVPGSEGFDLDYMHARYYDAGAGRFLSVDPVRNPGAMTPPQMLNRYSYVTNSPLSFTDPTGRYPCKVTLAGNDAKIAGVKSGSQVDGECAERKAPPRSLFGFTFPYLTFVLEGRAQKAREGQPNKSTLTPAQCEALFTVVQREARGGTQRAARRSSNTWGDRTIGQFNVDFNTRGNPTLSNGAMIDVDWFTDVNSYTGNTPAVAPAVYMTGKFFWHAFGGTKGWPFHDPGEVTAVSYATRGASYNEIYNQGCP
jgi:RHS repeat-associated protein